MDCSLQTRQTPFLLEVGEMDECDFRVKIQMIQPLCETETGGEILILFYPGQASVSLHVYAVAAGV